jgi:hypothetical protein
MLFTTQGVGARARLTWRVLPIPFGRRRNGAAGVPGCASGACLAVTLVTFTIKSIGAGFGKRGVRAECEQRYG